MNEVTMPVEKVRKYFKFYSSLTASSHKVLILDNDLKSYYDNNDPVWTIITPSFISRMRFDYVEEINEDEYFKLNTETNGIRSNENIIFSFESEEEALYFKLKYC